MNILTNKYNLISSLYFPKKKKKISSLYKHIFRQVLYIYKNNINYN